MIFMITYDYYDTVTEYATVYIPGYRTAVRYLLLLFHEIFIFCILHILYFILHTPTHHRLLQWSHYGTTSTTTTSKLLKGELKASAIRINATGLCVGLFRD